MPYNRHIQFLRSMRESGSLMYIIAQPPCDVGTLAGDNGDGLTADPMKRIYRLTAPYGRLEIEKEETNG